MRRPEKKLMLIGGVVLLIILLIILWPGHKEEVVQATDADCRRQLEALRVGMREYVAKYGRPPQELFDPKTVGVSEQYRCPVSKWNYSYNPKQWPKQWVICTYGHHRDF